MKGEISMCRRCCFCVPLRYGLLAWGYFKMTADAFILSLLAYSLKLALMSIASYENTVYVNRMYTDIIITVIAITVFFTDLIMTIVFIVGGHKKNVQLIRAFYYVSIGMWVVSFLLASFAFVKSVQNLIAQRYWSVFFSLTTISFYFVVVAVQTYFLLLLRSEIIKLRDNGEFCFVNNAAEAMCTMKCEDIVTEEETVKQEV